VTPPPHRGRPDLAPRIDHTLLRPDATAEDLELLLDEAERLGFATVCVSGRHVLRAARRLAGTRVGVSAVVGFPSGAQASRVKAVEAALAVDHGAAELDVVADLGALRSGDHPALERELRAVLAAARGRPVKVILETALFPDRPDLLRGAVDAARRAGARFVKTSTGFGPGGATVEAVALLREAAGPALGVKAAGGIRTAAQADRMLAAGADRLGTSHGVAIVQGDDAPSEEGR